MVYKYESNSSDHQSQTIAKFVCAKNCVCLPTKICFDRAACSEKSTGSMASAGSSSIGGHSALNVVGSGGGGGGCVAAGGPTDCASLSVSEDLPLELLGVPLGRQKCVNPLSEKLLSLSVWKCV